MAAMASFLPARRCGSPGPVAPEQRAKRPAATGKPPSALTRSCAFGCGFHRKSKTPPVRGAGGVLIWLGRLQIKEVRSGCQVKISNLERGSVFRRSKKLEL
jgi:hypothetical protein